MSSDREGRRAEGEREEYASMARKRKSKPPSAGIWKHGSMLDAKA